jgi:hypothetical protein
MLLKSLLNSVGQFVHNLLLSKGPPSVMPTLLPVPGFFGGLLPLLDLLTLVFYCGKE